ncbi:MAG: DUF1501 domain-containing protein [Planctomycetales bacterium]|nr:DUF1501 domain-containing protein [Planctomycetales bacterium]
MNRSLASPPWHHPQVTRRAAIQAGSIGLLGLGMNHVDALRGADVGGGRYARAKSVIYIFLSGGLAQHDSFDPKPDAPDDVRGEFKPIATQTPGLQICEHLPMLAQRSEQWALVRSLTHPYNEHSDGHLVMMTGRSMLPPGFNRSTPKPSDWPSIAAIANTVMQPPNNLPPAVVLPERLVHRSGRVIPGQFAGLMGTHQDPWFIDAAPFNAKTYGAYPEYEFHHARGRETTADMKFQAPNLSLPHGFTPGKLQDRLSLLGHLDDQRRAFDTAASVQTFDRHRQAVLSLLTDTETQKAFDVHNVDEATQDRYGRNSFGWSLLMARQLVEAGVSLVQVNLGNNESWDTHQAAFPNLKNYLLPPTDRAVAALIDDLAERGMLDETLIVMAGEFGRTPRIFSIPSAKLPGRDHWGAVQSVFLAGGGVRGGTVIGSSDRKGAFPHDDPQRPEHLAATIYDALGLPPTAAWHDEQGRPNHIYHAEPIRGLMS